MRKGDSIPRGELLFSLWPLADYIRRAAGDRDVGRRAGPGVSTFARWKRLMDVLDR